MLKGPLQWQVAEHVLSQIVGSDMSLGERINEQAIARHLGVSRTPVRAVLSHLADKGVLQTRPNHGFILCNKPASLKEVDLDTDHHATGLYERVLYDVLLGNLAGTVSQNALMRRYHATRGQLHSTLRRMTREGLAEPAPGRGWKVIRFSGATIRQGYRYRLLLEPAVLLEDEYDPDVEALEALRDDHAKMLANLSSKMSWMDLFSLDARFHVTLAEGSRNEFAVEAIQKQNRLRRLCEYLGYERLDRVRASFQEHIDILIAILDGDRVWASAQLRVHLKKSLKQSVAHFDRDIENLRQGKRRL